LYHNGTVNMVNDREDTMEISPVQTLAVAQLMDRDNLWESFRANDSFMQLFRFVFPEEHIAPERKASTGVRHVSGMIVLLAAARRDRLRAFLRFPESYLHPKAQLGLADMMISLSKPSCC
jgi:hypothetical protein